MSNLKMKTLILTLLFSLAVPLAILVLGEARAQTPGQASGQTPAQTSGASVEINAYSTDRVDLPQGQVISIEARIATTTEARIATTTEAAGQDKSKGDENTSPPSDLGNLGEFSLIGHARMVEHEGQKIAQVLVTKLQNGDREAVIAGPGLSAQFELNDNEAILDPSKLFQLSGDRSALEAAARALAAPPEDGEQSPANADETADEAAPVGASGGAGPANDQAASYETPERVEQEAEPVVTSRVTTEGCSVRIDSAQKVAIQQSRTITTENGQLTGEDACSDSEVRFPLQKNYGDCTDAIDLTALAARPRFKWFFTGSDGLPQDISKACEVDEDQAFEIVEDHDRCAVETDFANNRVVPQAALVYVNRDNTRVEARSCAPSASKPAVAMRESTAECAVRHDFDTGVSAEMALWTYVLEGVLYQASACADTETSYAHETVYKDTSGAWLCPRAVNRASNQVILQSRVKITVNDQLQYITACRPDARATDIQADAGPCADPSGWTHDVSAGVSYPRERWYYDFEGQREYVSECVAGAATIAHSVTTTGWQNHDDRLFAYALSTVTTTTPTGTFTVVSSQVLPGAQQTPYELDRTEDVPNGRAIYTGCNASGATNQTEFYTRPDGTVFNKVLGPGASSGKRNACKPRVTQNRRAGSARWGGSTGVACQFQESYLSDGDTYYRTAVGDRYSAYVPRRITQTMVREDGHEVSSSTRTISQPCGSTCERRGGFPVACSRP